MNFIKTIIAAMLAALVGFSSCSKDDDDVKTSTYYISLDNVETNGVDANGNSVANQMYEQVGAAISSQSFEGISKDDAIEGFNVFCSTFKNSSNGTLPNGVWVKCLFSLREGSISGAIITSKEIEIK